MSPAPQRRGDLRVLLGAIVGVLLGGVVIAAAILALTSNGGVPNPRKPLPFGLASNIRENVRTGGPIYVVDPTGGAGFWVAIEDGELVALLGEQPEPASCTLRWRGSKDTFTCDGEPVNTTDLARYRSYVQRSGDTKGLFMVELRKVIPG